MPDPKRPGGRIPQHPLVEALVPDPSQPPRKSVQLFGYPGKSTTPRVTRLWLDLDLTSYVDVPDEAIVHCKVLENDQGTMLWVDAGTKLAYSTIQSQEIQADFLSGSIASAHLGAASATAAAQAAGAPNALRASLVCASQFNVCQQYSIFGHGPCIATALCHTTIQGPCLVSHKAGCPSVFTLCKSVNYPCHSVPLIACVHSKIGCHSQFCQSQTIPCVSDVGCPTFGPCPSIACGGEGGGFGPVA